ncbi:MAG: hypothetical protein A3C07_03290 [Candidatus Sungbacteria bacterium RIFCSPHIGHO2_02_FULL_47_11]|uniref:Fibronectin type-III domain-containing protein n=1 Tax=Candidatus Sungbacteria bacterium RIFCSPHIGHO2_02_FULL_47_11 TaxID=1802270 RepID=A0A1G2KLX1_9BACT|nr:MAG: hypothetical protein A3C07_03290 [Candidatus Sungbacteria bacterium RIFCSPHIGHO2_02_FULL_47_11]
MILAVGIITIAFFVLAVPSAQAAPLTPLEARPLTGLTLSEQHQVAALAFRLETVKTLLDMFARSIFRGASAQTSSCPGSLITLLGDGCHQMYTDSSGNSIYCNGAMTLSAKSGDTTTTSGCASSGSTSYSSTSACNYNGICDSGESSGSCSSDCGGYSSSNCSTPSNCFDQSICSSSGWYWYNGGCWSSPQSGGGTSSTSSCSSSLVALLGTGCHYMYSNSSGQAIYCDGPMKISAKEGDTATIPGCISSVSGTGGGTYSSCTAALTALLGDGCHYMYSDSSGNPVYCDGPMSKSAKTGDTATTASCTSSAGTGGGTYSSCTVALTALLGTGCHYMYSNSSGQAIYCDGPMTKSAKSGDTTAASGCSSYGGGGSIVSPVTPKTPTNLTARVDGGNVILQWTDNSTNEDEDRIWSKSPGGSLTALVNVGYVAGGSGTYTHVGGVSGTEYLIKACSYTVGCSQDSNPAVAGGVGGGGACSTNTSQSACAGVSTCYWYSGTGYGYCDSAPGTVYAGNSSSCPGFSYSRWDTSNQRYCQLTKATACQYTYPDYVDPLKYSSTNCPAGTVARCGDGVCASSESYASCATDCRLPTIPIISNVAVSDVTSNSAAITWITDRPANSKIEYWITTITGDFKSDPAYVSNHTVTLTGLNASTTYTYNVVSQDANYYVGYAYSKKFATLPVAIIAQCSDGRDNDADGSIDYPSDQSCYGPEDNDEQYPLPGTATSTATSTVSVSMTCDSGLIALLGTGCHQMYTDTGGSAIYCDGPMAKSAKKGDTIVKNGCSSPSGTTITYVPPSVSCSSSLVALLGDGCHQMSTDSSGNPVFCDGPMTKSAKQGDTATVLGCSTYGGETATTTPIYTPTTSQCPSGYHYMGGGGGGGYGGGAGGSAGSYCMADSGFALCQPLGGGATYTCPGNATTTTATSTVAGDITPPYVDYSLSYPKSGDSNVLVNTKITVKFNEEVASSSFGTNQFFNLSEGSYVSTVVGLTSSSQGTFNIFSDGFEFVPASPLKAGVSYTWRIFPGIKDKAGNSSFGEPSASFTTAFGVSAGAGSVTGQVTDGSGNPVSGANVGLANSSYTFWRNTETAATGMYGFSGIPVGSYRLTLYPPSSKTSLISPSDVSVIVEKDKETKRDLAFLASVKTVSGTVKHSAGGAVTDARVGVYRQDGPGWSETETNSTGFYTLSVSGGTWQVSVYPKDYAKTAWIYDQAPVTVTFASDSKPETKTADLKVSLQNSKVTGKIVKPDGTAPKTYEVSVNLNSPGRGYPAALAADGSFSVSVSSGSYDLYVWSSDQNLKAPSLTVAVLENETKDVGTIRLAKPLEKITGRVLDESGTPIGGVSVNAYQTQGGGYSYGKTDAVGNYEISVGPGFWTVSVSGDSSGNVTSLDPPKEIEIKIGGTTIYNIRVALRDATIQGLIKDSAGNVVDDFYGSMYVEGTDRYGGGLGGSIDKGVFTLRVPGGTHKLVLSLSSYSGWTSAGAVTVTVVKGGTAQAVLTVKKNTSAITGSVLDSQGKVITGVSLRILASGEDGAWQDASVDSASGAFTLKVSAGTWFLKASSYGGGGGTVSGGGYFWKGEEIKVEVPEGKTVTQNLTLLSSNATIEGTVLKPDGLPMPNVWVSIDSRSTGSFTEVFLGVASFREFNFSIGAQTDTAGQFSVIVPAGTYFVHVYVPPQKGLINPEEQKVTVETGKIAEVAVSFRSPDALIRGTVLLESTPAEAFVAAWSEKGGYAETKSGSDGKYSLRVNRSDVWHAYAKKEYQGVFYKSSESTLSIVSEGAEVSQDLVLLSDRILPKPISTAVVADKPSTVALEDGATVAVPANSVASSGGATITIKPDAETPKQGNHDVVGIGYEVSIFDDKGQAVSNLNTAVTVSIPYDPEELKKKELTPKDLKIAFWDEKAGVWKELPVSIVNEEEHTVSAAVDHLTRFAIVAAADIVPPAAPTAVTGLALGEGKIKLLWTNPVKDFSHAKVYRSDKKGVTGEVRAAEVFGAEFTDDGGAQDGVFYQYTVRAVDPAGNESGNTDQISVLAKGTSAPKKMVLSVGKKEAVVSLVQKKAPLSAAPYAIPSAAVSGVLSRNMQQGVSGNDVKILQQFLADNGFYPERMLSGFFGLLTGQAVIRFQEKYASEVLAPAGLSKGNGFVGPGTRKKINELLGAVSFPIPLLESSEQKLPFGQGVKLGILNNLIQGSSGDEVKILQELLIKERVYPEGLITGFFGELTKQSVIRFQEKYAAEILAPVGMTQGSGYFGASSRAKANALLGK